MKKSLFLVPLVALAMASCTNNEPGNSNIIESDGSGFLAVSIVSPNTTTRADDEIPLDGGYENGSVSENEVNKVRFYFFDKDGNAMIVSGDKNYIDKDKSELTFDTGENNEYFPQPNVEKIVNSILVLDTRKNDVMALQMLAIINPPASLGEETQGNKSLSQLQDIVADHTHGTGGFIMSNSVYKGANGLFVANPIERLYTNEDDAIANPVEIYVERVEAKVRLALNLKGETKEGSGIYPAKRKLENGDESDLTYIGSDLNAGNNNQIYVKFDGWNVTTRADKDYLLKSLHNSWIENDPWSGWNNLDYHRSFWALNPNNLDWQYASFSQNGDEWGAIKNKNFGSVKTENDVTTIVKGDEVYVLENAADYGSKTDLKERNRTKVIIGAHLCDVNGNPITIAEFGGNRYLISKDSKGEYDFSDFKGQVLRYLPYVYYKKNNTVDDNESYSSISSKDVKIVTALQKAGVTTSTPESDKLSKLKEITDGERCYVYLELSGENEWYLKNSDGTFNPVKDENDTNKKSFEIVNETLAMLPMKIWIEGNTYYYFDITHLNGLANEADGVSNGKYGVVRNHIYATQVNNFYGLGTPVWDPNETIIPEKPGPSESMVAAEINILAWKIVNQGVTLQW